MSEIIHIDGSQGEGGGQILRTSLALSALLKRPVAIENIRTNRTQPGLKTQHLAGVMALAGITEAEVEGARLHSPTLVFRPRTLRGGKYRFEITTAGALTMLFGAVLPALLFAPQPSEVSITGGTHVPFSPPFHYLERIFLPILKKLGGEATVKLGRWGFYPNGGGRISGQVKPCTSLRGLQLARRGELQSLKFSACSGAGLPGHIARREIVQAEKTLKAYADKLRTEAFTVETYSPGNFVFLEAAYANSLAGFSCLGRRGRPAEEVADEVCRSFQDFQRTGATVDRYLADQMLLYAALAEGDSCVITEKTTCHLITNSEIIRKFLPAEINIGRDSGHIRVKGIGFKTAQP